MGYLKESGYYPPGAEFDENEEWKPIPEFEDRYLISNFGRVNSIGTYNTCKRGILSPMTDPSGYFHVVLYKNKTKKEIDMTKLILCDKDSAENNWDYKCQRLSSDDWDELADPCDGCNHRIFKRIEID